MVEEVVDGEGTRATVGVAEDVADMVVTEVDEEEAVVEEATMAMVAVAGEATTVTEVVVAAAEEATTVTEVVVVVAEEATRAMAEAGDEVVEVEAAATREVDEAVVVAAATKTTWPAPSKE